MRKINTLKLKLQHLSFKRHRRQLKSKRKRKIRRTAYNRLFLQESYDIKRLLGGDTSYENVLRKWLPKNLSFLLQEENSPFSLSNIKKSIPTNDGNFFVPRIFSLIEAPNESFKFLQQILGSLIYQKHAKININYAHCELVDLNAQVLMDILLKEIISFFNKCNRYRSTRTYIAEINGNVPKNKEMINKLLFSVGSPAIHNLQTRHFDDVIPYKLCIHSSADNMHENKKMERKDIDTTNLVEYVIESLARLKITLSPEKIDDLCIVISEILINAEEHSTTKHRFSIGYFQEMNNNYGHYGVFNLVILNFGKTIYEKFKDPFCPNKNMVEKMKRLSKKYEKKSFFFTHKFEEETLWTLYALQEGVTSIAPDQYRKRGNGSIQFIESFFNIKGIVNHQVNEKSSMNIFSGNSSITFDGTYKIIEKNKGDEKFKLMTFNETGNIEDKPDSKFVKFVDNYFPGAIISAKIIFNEIKNEIK